MDSTAPKHCPRCRLVNPPSAERCDCGYDFRAGKVEQPYFKQAFPKTMVTYIWVVAVVVGLNVLSALIQGRGFVLAGMAVLAVATYWLYGNFRRRKNWARIALGILTFPIGLVPLLSREAKFYCLQPGPPTT